jgi:hypothetical protein
MNATAKKYYAICTFGTKPKKTVFTTLAAAKEAASDCVGLGSCTTVRVYECDTRELAKTADISEIRDGERVVA